ncbi:MAG: hypothetical protein GY938_20540 [Ketobacter sp.]|nr:hypothetical protein [Ketobacter sp.]
MWYFLAILVVAAYASTQVQPKTPSQKPVAFEDFEFPQFEEGTPQSVIFGDCWTEDWFVLGVGNYRNSPIWTKSGK